MVDRAREVYETERVVGKNPKNVWCNDVVKASVEREEAVWKEVLGNRDEVAKDR